MTEFAQLALSGLMLGSIYGLVAMGFVLIYKSTQIFNLAVGEFVVFGSYVAWALVKQVGLSPWVAVLVALAFATLMGLALERFPLRPLVGQPLFSIIMVTIGIAIVLRGLIALFWANQYRPYPEIVTERIIKLGDLNISLHYLIGFLLALVILGAFTFFFRYTKIGLAMRATCEDHQVVQSFGVNINFIIAAVWVFAAVVSMMGGIILGMMQGVGIAMVEVAFKALPAALLGGLESVPGALIGGLFIGVAEVLVAGYVGQGLGGLVPFIIMVLVLLVKPYGLFGLERIERI